MLSFLKAKARKPLATGKPSLGYGMRHDVNEGKTGIVASLGNDKGERFTVYITNDELDRMIAVREQFRKEVEG